MTCPDYPLGANGGGFVLRIALVFSAKVLSLCNIVWCRRHKSARFSIEVLPPCAQWWMWWASHHADGVMHPGIEHVACESMSCFFIFKELEKWIFQTGNKVAGNNLFTATKHSDWQIADRKKRGD